MTRSSRVLGLLAVLLLALVAAPGAGLAAPSGPPIRVGGSLALTGPLAATALVHKIVGEIYVDELNRKNGLLGRPVEWVLLDDQSKPDLARTLYERLVTVDKVDLLIGPYATGSILSAMGVAQRYDKLLVHHTFGIPHLAKYERQFPAWALGPEPGRTFPNLLFDALAAAPKPPQSVAIVTDKFPSVHFVSTGAREIAQKRGLKEALYLEFEFGTRDFGPIAARIKDANPDFLWVGAIGLDGNQILDALKKIDYTPKNHFYLYPAPGPLAKAPEGKGALSTTIFEEHPPFTSSPGGRRVREALPRAGHEGRPALHRRRRAGGRVVHRLAAPGGRGDGDQGPRRQGARAVAQDEPGRHHHRQAALRRAQQLRRRPVEGEAGAGREMGGGVAEGVRGAGGAAHHPVTSGRRTSHP